VLLDSAIDDAAVRAVSFARVPEAALRDAVEETAGLLRPRHDDAIDFFGTRYSTIRQFAPGFLQTLTFHAQGPEDTVLRAIEVIWTLDRAPTRRPVPRDAPMGLFTDTWRPYMRESDGTISRRYYALCTLWHLRVHCAPEYLVAPVVAVIRIPISLLPPVATLGPKVGKQTGTPSDGVTRLVEREAELDSTMAQVERLATRDSPRPGEANQIVLSPLGADPRQASAEALAQHITERLPAWRSGGVNGSRHLTHFAHHFCHAADLETPQPMQLASLYASLVAHVLLDWINGAPGDLAYDHHQCTTWYRGTTPSRPFTAVELPPHPSQSQAWEWHCRPQWPALAHRGHKPACAAHAAAGYGTGVTFYSWTSDQLAVRHQIRADHRADATYVLDELCNNETELPIREHTTDTAGATRSSLRSSISWGSFLPSAAGSQ
jgi:hypothetical protein